jgi:hypothetical protein
MPQVSAAAKRVKARNEMRIMAGFGLEIVWN